MNIKLDDNLFRKYNELYALILQCYKDLSILDGFKMIQTEKTEIYRAVINISNHFIVLLQKDVALTLWKLLYDNNQNAFTIPRFRNEINALLRSNGDAHLQIKKEDIGKGIKENLILMRQQFLAHADMTRKNNRIQMSDLKNMLEISKEQFNKICDVVDDDRIKGVSETAIKSQDNICRIELLGLYSREEQ